MAQATVEIVTTSRLLLRPFTIEDRAAMIALQGNPEVMRYYGNGLPLEEEQIAIVLDAYIQCRWKGFWAWAMTREGVCVGEVTATCIEWRREQWIELCWLLLPAMWGQGFATEAVRAVMSHGVTDLGWRKMLAGADVRNTQSERVMVKNGMRFVREEPDAHGKMRRICTLIA